MSSDRWHDQIIEWVQRPNYRPVKPRVLAKQLDVDRDDVQDFKRAVKKLVKLGEIAYGEKHLVVPKGTAKAVKPSAKEATPDTKPKTGHVTGTFRRAPGGYGFVRPINARADHDRSQDLFITADQTLDASDGDVVLVRPMKDKRRPGGTRGAIVEVLERQTKQFVGAYFERGGTAWVQVDGTLFAQAIAVGDPGAKNAQPDDKVVIEMVRFPTPFHDGEGVIVEVLGARGQPGVDTLSILREFNLPEAFSEGALEVARAEAARFDESIPPTRLDLTHETIITIDPIDARDFDDAISLEKMPNGHWLLGVHIADVSHFVPAGSALDREAYQRGTSVYLPDRVIPMIPELISNGLASLQPDRVRYTKTAILEFNPEGIRVGCQMRSAAIRSRRRFTYEEVDEFLADRESWKPKLTPEVHGLLARMHELAMLLRRRRMTAGALELTMPEVKIDLDRDGRVQGAHVVKNTESHQIIEEFMLAANIAVAETLADREIPFLRRVHESPNPLKLKALADFVRDLGFQVDNVESRFAQQALLKQVAGTPQERAVNYALLRSMQQARYSPADEGHYALSANCYCHFTSPIRRYPDLTVHRLFDALVEGRKPKRDVTELAVVGEHCSQRERRAQSAERELTKVKLLHYLSERIGEEMDAVITGVEQFGLFVQGLQLPAEGLIQSTTLADDYYHFERSTHSLTGRRSGNAFRLGDSLRVTVARVDIDRRELHFRLVAKEQRVPKVAKPTREPKGHAPRHAKGDRPPKRKRPS